MVPFDRAMTRSYRLSIETVSLAAAIWPQLRMQTCCLQPFTHVRQITVLYPSVYCNVRYSSIAIAYNSLWDCTHSARSLSFRWPLDRRYDRPTSPIADDYLKHIVTVCGTTNMTYFYEPIAPFQVGDNIFLDLNQSSAFSCVFHQRPFTVGLPLGLQRAEPAVFPCIALAWYGNYGLLH